MSIKDHSIASLIPRSSGSKPVVLANTELFESLCHNPATPHNLKGYLNSDLPQLAIQTISFSDATLIGLVWPHTLLDALGREALFNAWKLVLQGRENEVLELHGYDQDPLDNLGSNAKKEDSVLYPKMLTGLALLLLFIRMLLSSLWHRKSEESRVICLPKSFVERLKKQANCELEIMRDAIAGKKDTNRPAILLDLDSKRSNDRLKSNIAPYISDHDILSAYIAYLQNLHQSPDSNQTIAIMYPIGLRSILSKSLLPAEKAYIGNALSGVIAFTTVKELLTKPIAQTASESRLALLQQSTIEQVEAFTALKRSVEANGSMAVFGDSGMKKAVISNWTKAKFFDIDFSAAVVSKGEKTKDERSGRPTYVHAGMHCSGIFTSRDTFQIHGKDAGGNYWISGRLLKRQWELIKNEFERID
jgi:hypothetical protein